MTTQRHRNSTGPRFRAIISVAATCIATAGFGGTATAAATSIAPETSDQTFECDRGMICLWDTTEYRGELTTRDLRDTNPKDCITLKHAAPRSLANRSDRQLEVYAAGNCDKKEQHATYPGGGTFAPDLAFPVAAVQLGESS